MFVFCCLGGGAGPTQTPKKTPKKTRPRPNGAKINTRPPLPLSRAEFGFQHRTPSRPNSVAWAGSEFIVLLFGRCACHFFAVWAGGRGVEGCLIFCCLRGPGRGRAFFVSVWAGGRVYVFAVWAGGRAYFLLCARLCIFAVWADVVFFAVWSGDGSSLTYRSAWLSCKGPNQKKDQTAKQNTGCFLKP